MTYHFRKERAMRKILKDDLKNNHGLTDEQIEELEELEVILKNCSSAGMIPPIDVLRQIYGI